MAIDWEEAYAFWQWSDNLLGSFHMYIALLALVLGPAVFLRRKGDITHRLLGMAYVFAMLITNVTALVMYDFTGGPNIFHFFAAVSLATLIPGLIFIIIYASTKNQRHLAAHIDLMSWSYFGLFMAAGAESFTRGLAPQMASYRDFWIIFGVFMVVAGGVGNFITIRLIRKVKSNWLTVQSAN